MRCRPPACRGREGNTLDETGQVHRERTRPVGGQTSPTQDAPRCIASTAPNTPMRSAICWRWRSTLPNCCRPTISATASTISATCCRSRRCCWSAICRRPARSAASRRRRQVAGALSDLHHPAWAHQDDRLSETRCRSARAAAPPYATASRWTANTKFRSAPTEQDRRISGHGRGAQARSAARRPNGFSCSPLPRWPSRRDRARRRNAPDAKLKVRMPVKAGTHAIGGDLPERYACFRKASSTRSATTTCRPISKASARHGRRPLQCRRARAHADPRQDFHLPSGQLRR